MQAIPCKRARPTGSPGRQLRRKRLLLRARPAVRAARNVRRALLAASRCNSRRRTGWMDTKELKPDLFTAQFRLGECRDLRLGVPPGALNHRCSVDHDGRGTARRQDRDHSEGYPRAPHHERFNRTSKRRQRPSYTLTRKQPQPTRNSMKPPRGNKGHAACDWPCARVALTKARQVAQPFCTRLHGYYPR